MGISKRILRKVCLFMVLVGSILIGFTGCNQNTTPVSAEEAPMLDSLKLRLKKVIGSEKTDSEKITALMAIEDSLDQISSEQIKTKAFIALGKEYRSLRADSAFISLNNKTRKLSIEINDSLSLAQSHYDLGRYYYFNDQIDSSYQSYFRAERVFKLMGESESAGKAMLAMAIHQKNERDYVGGEASTIKALEFLTPYNDLRYLASANNNLGLISTELGRYDAAIEYHLKALEYRKKGGYESLEASSYNNIGLAFVKKKEYDKAIQFYEGGLSYDVVKSNRPSTYARLLDNLAYAKFLSGDRDEFPYLFLRPLEIRDSIEDNYGLVTSNLHLSEYYMSVDSTERAYEYALSALEKSKPLKYHRGILESLDLLAKNSKNDEALAYSKERIILSDSLQIKERQFQERFARIRFETDNIEIEKEKATKLNRQLIILALSLGMLFLMIYIFIQRKVARKELQYQRSQQVANEEIYNLMLAQQQKLEEGKQLEKQRISEDLHDGVLGRLFGARLSLDSLNERPDEVSIASRTKYIAELKSIEEEIRQISHNLNASALPSKLSYIGGIEKLVDDQCRLIGLEYEFSNDSSIDWDEVPNDSKVHLFRIVQETFQNIRKHANATKVSVGFRKEGKQVLLDVSDNGDGMDVDEVKKGIGLKNMASRVQQLNGAIDLESELGNGTKISVKINI